MCIRDRINSSQKPGVLNVDYLYPAASDYRSFAGKHMNTIRLPILWERLQSKACLLYTSPSPRD
uniref:Uncharacterized protein n=1 Tax=Ralstonia solanacearum TaxID=305 RepID=A0A0S4WNC1_RALSL|nr:protein of unknown function [Ralstonia solanacearum]